MNIGLLLYPGCVVSGLFAFSELLNVANQRAGKTIFNTRWIGVTRSEVEVTTGTKQPAARMTVEGTLQDKDLDAVLIPGFWTSREGHVEESIKRYQPIIQSLQKLNHKTQLWGYCTGVCMIAESGRLNGSKATATWWLANLVQEKYTDINWSFSQTFIQDQHNITASGLNGYLPIAQSLIEKHYGEDVLKDIIDLMLIPKPERTAQPFTQIKLIDIQDKLLRQIYIWTEQTPASELNIAALAKALNMTERTLARKVSDIANLPLAKYMRLIKLNQASDLLIYSNLSITMISHNLGFSDDAAFRRSFKQVSNYTPVEYRQTFKR
jgi:transcriptional regulator GlxA family with amidase domain